ncbi:fimbrial protein [Zestomonas carbonaria]|uniref:Pilin (Type 1 fimbria component protein) n=1 Tax=Zestomonas carbonaria TaxID=2762745 RepID=A0A7U7EPT0_9GAMM|nr:fimbrial protein [Pseudomonas carbonaria]CAD5107945.1 hypothetical protein PSEWESI4_02228 [Pseudomonas carbonaria]
MKKWVLSLLLFTVTSPVAWAAGCSFESGYSKSVATIPFPSVMLGVPRDAPVGTELWSSGWQSFSGPSISCSSTGKVAGTLASGIGAAVPGFTSNGFSSVFATNVPGIGISVFWCNQDNCNPDYNQVTPISSLAWDVQATRYPLKVKWWVRLIKTGDIDTSGGPLAVSGVSSISYANLTVADLMLTGNFIVNSLACEVNPDSRNITVQLPTVAKTDFSASKPALPGADKARSFNINMLCDSGVKVSYQIDGPQALPDVLANAVGAEMATGVGVQLFQGDAHSTTVVPLATKRFFTSTSLGQPNVRIPLTARYYRTGAVSDISSGLVSTTATFTLFYE